MYVEEVLMRTSCRKDQESAHTPNKRSQKRSQSVSIKILNTKSYILKLKR